MALDLFAGAGGLSAGLEQAGWTVALAVDHDRRSVETHAHNFDGFSVCLDLANRGETKRLLQMLDGVTLDLIAGGPPCQPFSTAGRNKIRSLVRAGSRPETDARKLLVDVFFDVVTALRPRAVLLENVPQMALADEMTGLRNSVTRLAAAGYLSSAEIVNTADYGVPQQRRRLILLARSDGVAPELPRGSVEVTTVRQAIGDLPLLGSGVGQRRLPYTRSESPSSLLKTLRAGAEPAVVYDHITRPVRDDDREAFSLMTSTSRYPDLPERLRRYDATKFKDKYRRLGWDSQSHTVTAHLCRDGLNFIHPGEHRTISVREAARLQTFADRFRFAGSQSDAFRQIGNAVPPLFAARVSLALEPRQPTSSAARSPVRANESGLACRQTELEEHAYVLRDGDAWFTVPTQQMDDLTASVVAALHRDRVPLVKAIPITDWLIAKSSDGSQAGRCLSSTAQAVLNRVQFADVGPRSADGPSPIDMCEDILGPVATRYARLLTGADVVIETARTLRTAADWLGVGRPVTGVNARLGLGQLIGGGPAAPDRMAALFNIAHPWAGSPASHRNPRLRPAVENVPALVA